MPSPPADETHLVEEEIASEALYEGQVVNLHLQTVRLPNGQTSQREVIKHTGAAAVVPLRDDGQVVLIRQFRKAVGRVLWELPAGTLEPDETPLETARRELQEEIGYRPRSLQLLGSTHVAPGYTSEIIHIYLADGLEVAPDNPQPDEFIDVVPMPLSEALSMIAQGQITDAKTIIGLLLAEKSLQKR